MTEKDSEDPLEVLRAHLRSAQAAAQRLLDDSERTPPAGWEPLSSEQAHERASQLHSLTDLVRSIREALPEDVLAQLADLIRAVLNVLRALVDLLLSRLSPQEHAPRSEIQEIPIV